MNRVGVIRGGFCPSSVFLQGEITFHGILFCYHEIKKEGKSVLAYDILLILLLVIKQNVSFMLLLL